MTVTQPSTGATERRVGRLAAAARTAAWHLLLYTFGAGFIWASAFGLVAVVALVCWGALAAAIVTGILLSVRPPTRQLGAGLVLGSLAAGVLQVALTIGLLAAYSSAHPGWDLS